MDRSEMLKLLEDVAEWNRWRAANPAIQPDLFGQNLQGRHLSGADLSNADLRQAWLQDSDLAGTNLSGADLSEAILDDACLVVANLSGATLHWVQARVADFSGADFSDTKLESAVLTQSTFTGARLDRARFEDANLHYAVLTGVTGQGVWFNGATMYWADLSRAQLPSSDFNDARLANANLSAAVLTNSHFMGADLRRTNLAWADLRSVEFDSAVFVDTNLVGANLSGSQIYGISAWNVRLRAAVQTDLRINRYDEPEIVVDNLEVAQFVYMLLKGSRLRTVIDTVTTKAVLILGRFSEDRKPVLDGIRDTLRQRGFIPILFDWDPPANRDLTETVSTLAHLSRFVIADLTDPRSIPHELEAIVPALPSVPVQPIIQEPQHEYGMFEHLQRFPWVRETFRYRDQDHLLENIDELVMAAAQDPN